jgi:carbamoyl-phosphate synthase small subunit
MTKTMLTAQTYIDANVCLALEDGQLYYGQAFGAPVETEGEVVFNTSMTGYQEIATDPSYHGQMVVLTHPQIGNYGVQREATESKRPWVAALIVRDLAQYPNHWLNDGGLSEALAAAGVPAMQKVDTRALTRHLRDRGTMRAVMGHIDSSRPLADQTAALVARAQRATPLSEKNLVEEASDPASVQVRTDRLVVGSSVATALKIVLVDCGVKHNIARSLSARGAEVVPIAWNTPLEEVLAIGAQGVVISNGPGDPERMDAAAELVRGLMARAMPTMGICLGHQVFGLAAGGTTSRLRFGHHGGNHPVRDLSTERVYITSQNHEFQVDAGSIKDQSGFVVSLVNLNDGSVEGLAHRELPAFSVQYHPEGCPGPQDNQYIFERFLEMVAQPKAGLTVMASTTAANSKGSVVG